MSNDQSPEQKGWLRQAVDDIVHAWPLIALLGVILVTLIQTWGDSYITKLVNAKIASAKESDPVISELKTEISTIKVTIASNKQIADGTNTKLDQVVNRLDTLIRIQLEQ